ncbi:hypothetical protein JX265_001955 [Neoarthrinium moseri]|uniref:PCI domain-containing protein n=1 Tax=Neoarthrinium moseri TaxID=1658444 RepID=A0A9Q0AR57_9PEZI|nr:hypothetical protein JX265_001955 [Neoarthrinium moseri]
MPGKTPQRNGKEPVENGIRKNKTKDVEMTDDKSSLKGKGKGQPKKGTKEGEDMTVVVPPSKNTKQSSAPPPADADGDVAMDESDKPDDLEVKVDPVTQAITGTWNPLDDRHDDDKARSGSVAMPSSKSSIIHPPYGSTSLHHHALALLLTALATDIKSNFALLDRAVALFDARFSLRALRSISSLRKRLTPDILAQVVSESWPASSPSANVAKQLLAAVGKESTPLGRQPGPEMEIDSEPKAPAKNGKKEKEARDPIPEIDIFLGILAQVHLFDSKQYQQGARFSKYLTDRIQSLNRRTLDSLSAKVYFYYSLFCEQLAPLPPSPQSPIVSIRPTLLAALRTAVLRKDVDTQATVIVLLLRSYLLTSHISQADLLVSHTQFPENAANNQVARFLYYLGRIRAIQLRYTEAHEHLTAATRKAPASSCALGFSQTATKLLLVVELLMGDIPERSTFRQANMEQALHPYFLLVQAVRVGNLEDFETNIADHAETFRRDGTYSLILRLRQNVIKTGIRMMSLSYSRISLRDICIRLHLGSEESAEYIVAKAIRDGVIEATLDRERGFMKSKEVGDVYATREPGEAFHDRIRACLALHDESVKAMRFPMNQHRLELKNAQEAREREREMAKEIQEGDLDEDDLGGDFEGM